MYRRLAIPTVLFVVAVVALVGAGQSSASPSHSSSLNAAKSTPKTAATTVSGPGGPLGPSYDTTTTTTVTLSGAGANSIEPFFEAVFYDYNKSDPKTKVSYSPAGSSVGISDIEQGTVDFGDTEIPMTASDLAKATGGTVLQIPVDLGGVAISYNVPGAPKNLKLNGPTLAGIFDGSITNWDAPQIAKASGVSDLPNLPIVPVHRADSSGPGWDLDDYLIKTSPAWVSKIGTSTPSTTWPLATVGVGQQLNTGVATYVKQTSGAVGFVSYGYALQANFANAALKNVSGSFVAPSVKSIALAGSKASKLSATNFSIIDERGARTYPLANFSWTLLYQKQSNQTTGIAVGKLIDYVVTTAQKDATSLGYSPLPANVEKLAVDTLDQLETPAGGPLFSH
jgi:phosphate transport system substrate-binding protein